MGSQTCQVFSADEYIVDELLAGDDEYNKTDEPTAEKVKRHVIRDELHIQVLLRIHISCGLDSIGSPQGICKG